MIGKRINQYSILEKLGEGGMGEVYLADDKELKRKVALKFLSEAYASDREVLARFKREAQMAAALNHPNIITVYEVGQFEERPYIAMAYIEGQSLAEMIGEGALPLEQVLDIGEQIGKGLGHAHDEGVVHRDIKPDNVFLEHNGRVKILDFGLAKLGGGSKLTGATSTFGTIYYMSPEQVRGEEVDNRSDVFSFGVLLYEMLTGKLPFSGDHSAAIIYSITNEDPKPLSAHKDGLPDELEQIVTRALSKIPDDRYQTINDMLADFHRYQSGRTLRAAARPSWFSRFLVPTSVVFAAVVLFLIFNPFKVEISPDQQAVAADNSLAIMYFENVVNPEDTRRLGEIVTNLLITDLSESQYMDVVSSQRLYDILKLQGKEGEKVIDRSTATDVASHADAKWMLLGSILQEEPTLIVTSQLVDVKTGKVAASQRITGGEGEEIFALVDRLTSEIKKDLAVPTGAVENDIQVAEATTHSTEAYRYYLEGMDNLNKYYGPEAKESFAKALEYDSTFAMAYLRQASGLLSASLTERRRAIARAVQHSGGASTREKHYIASANALISGDPQKGIAELEALIVEHPNEKDAYKALGDIYRNNLGEAEKAIAAYRRAIEIDPMDKGSYNTLAYLYQGVDDIDNYIWAIYQYMSLAPDEANPYDSRGDLYAYSGKTEKAIKSYQKALKRKPDFRPSQAKIGHMYMFNRDYDSARSAYSQLVVADAPDVRAWGRGLLALPLLYEGRIEEALETLDEGIAADRAEGFRRGTHTWKYSLKADALAARHDYAAAIRAIEKGLEITMQHNPDARSGWLSRLAELQAVAGDFASAEATFSSLESSILDGEPKQKRTLEITRGVLECEKGNATQGCVTLEASGVQGPAFYFEYHLARAYLEAGRITEAISRYEAIARRYSEARATYPIAAVKLYYYIGLAYEASGRAGKAIEQFTLFLDIWQGADDEIPEIQDARRRLAGLDRS